MREMLGNTAHGDHIIIIILYKYLIIKVLKGGLAVQFSCGRWLWAVLWAVI